MSITLFMYVVIGGIVGLIMGALPGLTVTMTMVLVVSLTFGFDMITALAFISGAFCGGVMGGSIASIALNIPGTAAAVATGFDGYPLKKKGKAAEALGLSMFVSLIGGLFGIASLVVLGELVGGIALKFGNQEYFLLTLWGLSLVSVLSGESILKGIIATCVGLIIGMVGMDPITGLIRFTFGSRLLLGGVHYVVAMIGLFGMKEVFVSLNSKYTFKVENGQYRIRDLLPKFGIIKKVLGPIIWSAPIGTIIGFLPGTGGDIGALAAYGVTKQLVKNPTSPFGQGAYEGVAAPETANDAAIGGAFTTLLSLGIPGDSVTAVVLGSFYMHGLLPGPLFMMTQRYYFYMIVVFLLIGVFVAYFFGIVGSNIMLKMISLPKWYLIPFISTLCIVGSYALQNNIYDVIFMLCFGLLGFCFEKAKFPVSPIVLAIILGPMIENNFRKALISTGSAGDLLVSFFSSPISFILLIAVIITFFIQSDIFFKVIKKIWSIINHKS